MPSGRSRWGLRHSSAAVLLEDLARVREACGFGGPVVEGALPEPAGRVAPALLPPPLVEREAPLAALEAALSGLAEARPGPRAVALLGPPGVGKKIGRAHV